MRKQVMIALVCALLALPISMLAACNNDESQVRDGDNPVAIAKLQTCLNSGGTPIMHSADGYLYVYCIHKSGR